MQISLVALMQANRGQLTVVGDDAQSIYGFRGASNRAFEMLQAQIPDAITNLALVLNYRSVPAIIAVCCALCCMAIALLSAPTATGSRAIDVSATMLLAQSACTGFAVSTLDTRDAAMQNVATGLQVGNCILEQEMAAGNLSRKSLECTRTDTNPAAEWHQFGLAHEEADFIVAKIKELHAAGTSYREMACLCRCGKLAGFPGALGVMQHLKRALVSAGIPHRAERGSTCAPTLLPRFPA